MNDDKTPRYVPDTMLLISRVTGFPVNAPVTGTVYHPAGYHPEKCPIVQDMGALEVKTAHGSRWFGCDTAYINSELRMVIVGTNSRDEVRMKWKPVPVKVIA